MTQSGSLAIILAAGKGTRMKSAHPKVMHPLAGRPMLDHVLEAARMAEIANTAVVLAPGMDALASRIANTENPAQVFVQEEQLGTADAVLAARGALENATGPGLILYGDTPLLTRETIQAVLHRLGQGADLVVLGFEAEDPTGYGRLLTDDSGALLAIREHKDASEEERAVTLCNSGVMGFRSETFLGLLTRIGCDNANGEYYLTDAVALAGSDGLRVEAVACAEEEVLGVNTRAELARAESILQNRLRLAAMDGGVTMTAPETVFLSIDTRFGRDILLEPHVFIGEGVTVGDNATIKAYSHLERTQIGEGATVGPFARLRPGAQIGDSARVGNFVEIKNATLEDGAKVNHLTYIGDARVGKSANVGAGTITCNYDGFEKHHTDIGAGAFIGSNSALVAPVKIGDGAYIGSGSVITKDVETDALALTRGPLKERAGWAAIVRKRRQRSDGKKR